MSSDLTAIRSIAVTVEDVVTAVEMNQTGGRDAVLRLTPPFSGRMRARLHVEGTASYAEEPTPIHVPPARLLTDDAPPYPRPSETEDELRADPDVAYTVDRHRERHAEAVDQWRAAIPSAIGNRISLETDAGSQEIEVVTLGDPPRQLQSDR